MNTGSLLCLSEEESAKIDLIYNYIEKWLYVLSKSATPNAQQDYWKYKLIQS